MRARAALLPRRAAGRLCRAVRRRCSGGAPPLAAASPAAHHPRGIRASGNRQLRGSGSAVPAGSGVDGRERGGARDAARAPRCCRAAVATWAGCGPFQCARWLGGLAWRLQCRPALCAHAIFFNASAGGAREDCQSSTGRAAVASPARRGFAFNADGHTQCATSSSACLACRPLLPLPIQGERPLCSPCIRVQGPGEVSPLLPLWAPRPLLRPPARAAAKPVHRFAGPARLPEEG